MDNSALFLRQDGERLGKLPSEYNLIRIGSWRKNFIHLGGESLDGVLACAPAAHEVDRQVVRQPEQKRTLVSDALERLGARRQPSKQILQHIMCVRLVASQVQCEAENRLSVGIINSFQFADVSHLLPRTRTKVKFVYAKAFPVSACKG